MDIKYLWPWRNWENCCRRKIQNFSYYRESPLAFIDGMRPGLTPDWILYEIKLEVGDGLSAAMSLGGLGDILTDLGKYDELLATADYLVGLSSAQEKDIADTAKFLSRA